MTRRPKQRLLIVLGLGTVLTLIAMWSLFRRDFSPLVPVDDPSVEHDPSDQQGFHPPLVRLIYVSQEKPTSDYTITAYPACAPPGSKIACQYPNGNEEAVATVKKDGSFMFKVPYKMDPKRLGLSITALNQQGEVSSPVRLRTDYPLMGFCGSEPNERGWMGLASASMSDQQGMQEWKDYTTAVSISIERQKHWAQSQGKTLVQVRKEGGMPDSLRNFFPDPLTILLRKTVPEDLKVYGYATAGELVTCILLADGSSFVEPVRSDSTFSVVIPYQNVNASGDGRIPYAVNITDRQNHLIASTGVRIDAPRWVGGWQGLIGQTAPDVVLERVNGQGTVRLKDLRGQVVLINVWATWCKPCVLELQTIEKLYPEFHKHGVELLTVDVWEPAEQVRAFLRKRGYTFPVLRDPEQMLTESYHIGGVPTTIVVDRAGIVRFFRAGPMTEDEFWAALRKGGVE